MSLIETQTRNSRNELARAVHSWESKGFPQDSGVYKLIRDFAGFDEKSIVRRLYQPVLKSVKMFTCAESLIDLVYKGDRRVSQIASEIASLEEDVKWSSS